MPRLSDALALLPPAQQAATEIVDIGGRTKADAARLMGLNESSIRRSRSRAHETLRRVAEGLPVTKHDRRTAGNLREIIRACVVEPDSVDDDEELELVRLADWVIAAFIQGGEPLADAVIVRISNRWPGES